MKFSLEKKIVIGFTLILLVMAVLGYFSFENNRAYAATNRMVAHTNEVIHHIEQLTSGLVGMQSGVRGYALTHDSLFLQSFTKSKTTNVFHLGEIRKLVSDNATQLSSVDSIEPLIKSKTDDFTNITAYIAQSSGKQVPVSAWYSSKVEMDKIKSILATMKGRELKLLKIRIAASEEKQREFFTILMLIFAFIACVLLFVYLIVFYNLQKRNSAEVKLQKDWSMFRAILDNANAVISVKDLDGKFILVNNKFLSFSKTTAENILNKRISDLVPKAEAERQEQFDKQVIESGQLFMKEITLLIHDVPKTFIVTKFPLLNNDNKTYALCTISTDISERKQNEEKIESLNLSLNQNLMQLENANREMESFTYSVSHDLRAPLRSIDGYTRILQEDYGEKLDEEGIRLLSIVIQNASRMAILIDDLLNFSRIGKLDLNKSEVHMHTIVEQIVQEFHPEAKHIKTDFANQSVISADKNLIRQVWINLISNAVKYSAKNPNAQILIGCTNEDGKKVFFIRDNGVGFNMKYAHKLFGVFQRLHGVEEFEGTGVGLAIVQRIVQKHGGAIWADAAPEIGATFYFHLGD